VIGDPGWNGGFRYVFGNGTTNPDVVVQGIRDSSYLYLSLEADDLPSLTQPGDPTTIIVLAFDFRVGSATSPLQKIMVKPVVASPVIQTNPANIVGVNSGTVSYWTGATNSAGVATWTSISTPSWLLNPNNQVGYLEQPTGTYHWFLEMKLPITASTNTGVVVPSTGTFGLYANVFRVTTGGVYEESWWPPTSGLYEPGCAPGSVVGGCTPDGQVPDPGLVGASPWGTSTVDPAQTCNGVSVGSQINDIFTDNTPNSKISLTPGVANTFHAYIQNTSVDGSGTPIIAQQVKATFKIANFGLPSADSWGMPGTLPGGSGLSNNPTSPADIPATTCISPGPPTGSTDPNCILSTGKWTLNSTEITDYSPSAATHQCILTQLDSTPGNNTTIINNAAIQNMDFGLGASKFERVAEISAKGYPQRPPNADGTQNQGQLFDLHVITQQEVLNPGQTVSTNKQPIAQTGKDRGKAEGQVVSRLTWVAHGCRHTGRFMLVDEKKIELCDPVGAFGYVVDHVGKAPVGKWNLKLTGPGLYAVQGKDNTYQINVPQDGVATVTTFAEPQEQGGDHRFAVFLDAGANFLQGTLGSGFNTGFSLNAGGEYLLTNHFSVEGISGYHHFPGTITPDLDVYQFSANGKAYLTTGRVQPFVNGGVGGYRFTAGSSSSSTYFGGNVGAGVLFNLTSRFGLQGSYNFHAVDTPVEATKFSTVQGGIRFVF